MESNHRARLAGNAGRLAPPGLHAEPATTAGSAIRIVPAVASTLDLHSLSRGGIGDAGQYKQRDVDIIETYPDGRSRVRFKTVPAERTSAAIGELISSWNEALEERRLHPLLAVAAFNLDFLCIHPFRDGNS